MSGYAPAFDTIFTGTLHGQWPDIGLWLCLIAMADKHGHVDCTPQYIAGVTGLAVTAVTECIERFMQPDQYSRTPTQEGRRLELIDPKRPWGWRIINHAFYREKARLMAKNQREVESGKNAERMGDRRGPPETAGDPLSNANAKKDLREDSRRAASGEPKNPDSLDKALFAEARKVFGDSIGGQVNKAIRSRGKNGKAFVLSLIEACRDKDQEAAKAYFAAALKGQNSVSAEQRRRHPG